MLRRELLQASVSTLAVGAASTVLAERSLKAQPAASQPSSLRYCLNMSTIEGGKVELPRQIQIAAQAGLDGVDLWLRDIQRYVSAGGKLSDIRK
ncbi:MAG: sugar phosphate isomerase/epimerase, partial [Pirellulaceae bacterium]